MFEWVLNAPSLDIGQTPISIWDIRISINNRRIKLKVAKTAQ